MKIIEVLNFAQNELKKAGIESEFYEARTFLEYVLDTSKEWIMVHINDEIPEDKRIVFEKIIKARITGVPMQYIIGKSCFMGNDFFVSNDVLIPRSDTEVWVEEAIKIIRQNNFTDVLDLCTGSGCIAISIKKAVTNSNVCAVDISEGALKVARKNAVANDVLINFLKSDMFTGIGGLKFDIIVSNPPYIPSLDVANLSKEVLNEPVIALDGGNDGLDFYRTIAEYSGSFIRKGGYLILEIGYNQAADVVSILMSKGFSDIRVIKDYSQNDRAVLCRWEKNDE